MPRTPLRIALIGAGNMARQFHGPSLAEISEGGRRLALRAVCDLDVQRAEALAGRFGFQKVYGDVEALLDAERLDAVWVITPIQVTAKVVTQVARRGLPVFLEKPPAASLTEGRRLVRTVRNHRVPTRVSFNRRTAPALLKALELVRAEGPVKAVQASQFRHRRLEEHFMAGTGIHAVDAMRAIAGEIVQVVADPLDFFPSGRKKGKKSAGGSQAGTAYFATLRFQGGAVGQLAVNPSSGADVERYIIHGEECIAWVEMGQGWLSDYPGRMTFQKKRHEVVRLDYSNLAPSAVQPWRVAGFLGSSEAFVRALETGRKPDSDVASGVRSMEVAAAIAKGGTRRFRP